jgi:hypothetical protein
MMQAGERHVVTIGDPPLIRKVLNTLSTDVGSEGGEVLRTLKRLEKFAKEGCGRLILNLDAMEESRGEMHQEVSNVGASLVGGVLVVTCRVTSRELLRIRGLTRRNSFPKQLVLGFDSLFSSAADRIRAAFSRADKPKAN